MSRRSRNVQAMSVGARIDPFSFLVYVPCECPECDVRHNGRAVADESSQGGRAGLSAAMRVGGSAQGSADSRPESTSRQCEFVQVGFGHHGFGVVCCPLQ